MNLNVKLDGEEEQALQYVNRFAINIPSGAINLNIVNPGLSNQSYILNPMNPVGQNIVAYQPPMALQSYIALPSEAEGNIIHSLPVGVSVPVGLPVQTGLLQNNFVNTSIIIGDEDCNSPGVIKSAVNNINPENEIKINYIEKPIEKMPCSKANGIEVQSIGVNCLSQLNAEAAIKKPCPLEMSIKAANIDIEFEKCEPEVPILLESCQALVDKQPILVEALPLAAGLKDDMLKVPLEVPPGQPPNVDVTKEECKKVKTEITWENNNNQALVDNGFQESLICEVEEEDEEEEDEDEEEEEEEEVEEEEEEEEEEEGDEDEEESGEEKEVNNSNCAEGMSSSEESDSLPLSVALKLNKLPNSKSNKKKKNKRGRGDASSSESVPDEGKTKKKKSQRNKKQKREDEDEEEEEEGEDWPETDEDVLNLKRIKNEFNYKCFYEPNSTKSTTSLVLKIDDAYKKFVRVRSCCSKRECGKKISVQDQKSAHKAFNDLDSSLKRDSYLTNCIEHVQKARNVENAKDKTEEKLLEKTKIQLEIENESNGNQKLSDEIQKAINESLKDCAANERENEEGERKRKEGGPEEHEEGSERKNSWNFYIVIDRCRKKVCLQFLLKLFQIPKSRIKNLQKKILSGTPLTEDLAKGGQKPSDIWEVAKSHLDGLDGVECVDCSAIPRHRFLTERRTKEELFDSFKDFYCNKLGKAPNIKYASYKRFLDKKTSISFCLNQEGICAECEELKKHKKRKQNKGEKGPSKGKKSKECKKQWVVKTDSEENSSDDEPLLKRKKLKLTIPLKAVNSKPQLSGSKRPSKKFSVENKNKGKSKQSGSRGRDVWSLMLLHLETMPYKECRSCVSKKRHRFLDSSFTTQGLFEDYRKYFLKETNSELGLGFTMYEKYFNRNCNYSIYDVDVNAPNCPSCVLDATKS